MLDSTLQTHTIMVRSLAMRKFYVKNFTSANVASSACEFKQGALYEQQLRRPVAENEAHKTYNTGKPY